MTREIKFRAWDKESKKMLKVIDFWELWMFEPKGIMATPQWAKDNLEIMQFTGLKDKNGKENSVEIYDGDLMRSLPNGYEPREIFEVYWDNEMSGWMMRDVKTKLHHKPLEESYQVIGNIYETTEVIK